MKLKLYQADAFTEKVFGGNPAAVCVIEKWLSDELMLNIASENNLAETAFAVKTGEGYEIRWFTPMAEVELCGHATLATAHILFNHLNHPTNEIIFYSMKRGELRVKKEKDILTLDFPADTCIKTNLTEEMQSCFNIKPVEVYEGLTDYMFIFNNENEIKNCIPDFVNISKLKRRGVIITAKGNEVDFVSRFFAPQVGVNEDPVTGSAHTSLTPYWAAVLGKKEMKAIQLSSRKGHLSLKFNGDRVEISGHAVTYLIGEIEV